MKIEEKDYEYVVRCKERTMKGIDGQDVPTHWHEPDCWSNEKNCHYCGKEKKKYLVNPFYDTDGNEYYTSWEKKLHVINGEIVSKEKFYEAFDKVKESIIERIITSS